MNEESIFAEALNHEAGPQREAYLEQACGGDTTVRRQVENLLREHDRPDSIFHDNRPDDLVGSTIDRAHLHSGGPEQIASYRLLHLLGEGGMGAVYLAEQQQPIKRRVAVKVIKQGMNSQLFIARFEAEQTALAMMDHPNIAKVLDAGCTEDGRPFFVMELVKGIPITQFCDENRLTTDERLKLFVHVCQAVQHAHQKGIIHRDLKPSNVMVAMYDDQPVPKVIDFGVAKATHQPLTEQTLYTVPGQIVGTWEYMSPEQAILNQLDVDTRTDIYSLGVILYELLTGKTPLDLHSLEPGALEERLRRIREHEPSRPSLRISTLDKPDAGALAKYHKTEASSLAQSLRGDLDWIVMKALEKDRSRRYETANGFAMEIRRYLNDEPISFRPPSNWYRFTKFYQRNRSFVASIVAVFVILAVGLAVCLVSLNHAWRQQRIVMTQSEELRDANVAAEVALEQVEVERDRYKETLAQLRDELIEKALVHAQNGEKGKMEAAIARALAAGADKNWEPILQSQLHTYGDDPSVAVSLLEKVVAEDPENVTAQGMLATAHIFNGSVEGLFRQFSVLRQLDATSEFDKLYKGTAMIMVEDKSALSLIQDALSERMMPMGLAIEAQALGHVALDTSDNEKAQQALDRIQAARVFLPHNRYVRMIDVSVHHTAYSLGVESVTKERYLELLARNSDMGTYGIGHLVLGMCYDDLDNKASEASEAYRAAAQNGDWWGVPMWHICRREGIAHALFFLDGMINQYPSGKTDKLHNKEILQILSGQIDKKKLLNDVHVWNEKARAEPDDQMNSYNLSCAVESLLIAGEIDAARQAVQNLETNISALHHSRAITLSCLIDDRSDELVQAERQSMRFATQINYTRGLIALASNSDDAVRSAKEYFKQAINTKFFFYDDRWKSKAMLQLLEDGHVFPTHRNR